MLDQGQIRQLIPHSGTMCLLEQVIAWDESTIECGSRSHRHIDNPLLHDGRIGAICGVEYCLQAMAVHGALIASARQPIGYLVRIGDVALGVGFLDELGPALVVRATLAQSLPSAFSYSFSLSGGDGAPAISGRATIALVG